MRRQHQNFTFQRHERLRGRKNVGELFASKDSFFVYPFKILIHTTDSGACLRVLITVSKRNHSKAVDRNRIKRLIREAWRLQKPLLIEKLQSSGRSLDVALVYTAKEIYSQQQISAKINKLILRLIETNETSS
jgi:ribonuclease P protein component